LLPRGRPRAVPWGARTVLLVVIVFVAVAQLVSATYSVLSGKAPDEKYSEFELLALMSAINALLLVLVPLILRLTSHAQPEHLGIERQGWRDAAAVGGIGFLLLTPVVYAINAAMTLLGRYLHLEPQAHPLEEMVMKVFDGKTAALAWLAAVVLAPAAEELIFRGVVQGW